VQAKSKSMISRECGSNACQYQKHINARRTEIAIKNSKSENGTPLLGQRPTRFYGLLFKMVKLGKMRSEVQTNAFDAWFVVEPLTSALAPRMETMTLAAESSKSLLLDLASWRGSISSTSSRGSSLPASAMAKDEASVGPVRRVRGLSLPGPHPAAQGRTMPLPGAGLEDTVRCFVR